MFDQTFVDHAQTTKEPFALAASVFLESFAVGLLILIPLIYTQALPSAQLKNLLTAPPPPSAPPKPPAGMKQQRVVAARTFSIPTAPTAIPKQINPEIRTEPDIAVPGGVTQGNATDNVITGIIGSVSGPPPPAPGEKPKPPSKPLRVATGVAEANLIHKVMPVYPPLAKSARVQGTVEFTAIINKEGTIENLRLVHGHPLLVQAAREAVLQWKYRPTLLNGEPVEVVTDIIVNFTLSQ